MNTAVCLAERIKRAQAGDREECGRIIEENSALIWSVARRFFGRGADPEDLYQLGCIGMMKAVRGFDFSYETEFSTYAVPKISGEIRRFLRDDGIVKVSRQVKSSSWKIAQARERLCAMLGREPHLSELAEETGICQEDIAVAFAASSGTISIQQELMDDGITMENVLGTEGVEEEIVDKVLLSQALDTLPDMMRQVIRLRFFKMMTQEQAARILNISQVQVSRLERRAIDKLKMKIG